MGKKQSKESQVLVVGLDNSGKSTIINYFKPQKLKAKETVPTVGFQVEKFKYASTQFTMFDMAGHGNYRSLWEVYFKECKAIIFVVDSSDKLRMSVVKEELGTALHHKDIADKPIPILFYANKMDIADCYTANEIATMLDLAKISNRSWQIIPSNAKTGAGLEEGMKWLTEML